MNKYSRKMQRRENRRKKYEDISTKNKYGISDFTPSNAINGTMIISKMVYEKR